MRITINISSVVRTLIAVVILVAGLFISAGFALLVGMYLYEGESGLDRLTESYSQWQLAVAVFVGAASIAGYRKLIRRKAISWWLLASLIAPAASAVYLACIPASS